jgi:hypothetical protein
VREAEVDTAPALVASNYPALPRAGVAGDDLQRVNLQIKLAGGAVQGTDGAPDEPDPRRNVVDAQA